MKKKVLSIFLMLIVGIFIFSGCTNGLLGGPELTDPITSNGDLSVQKGNYLYFANGYTNSANLVKGDNKLGKVKHSALYRAELDSDGNLQYDEEGNLIKVELLVSKIVGFENGGIYIFDDKIYFASPNDEQDKTGSVDFTKLDFYSANLNGTNIQRIYKTEVGSKNIRYQFYKFGGVVYLAVYDSANLYIVDVTTNAVKKVADGVSNVAMPKVTEYVCTESQDSDTLTDAQKYIYYARTAVKTDNVETGNVLAMVSITTGQETVIAKNATYQAIDFNGGNLIYTQRLINEDISYYYTAPYVNASINTSEAVKLTQQSFSNAVLVLNFENGNYRGLLTTNASGYMVVVKPIVGGVAQFDVLNEDTKLTPIKVYGDDIYCYNEDKELFVLNYKTKELKQISNKDNETLYFDMLVNIDTTNGYVYVYEEYVGDNDVKGYYLVRYKTTLTDVEEAEVLGTILPEHIKTEEESGD